MQPVGPHLYIRYICIYTSVIAMQMLLLLLPRHAKTKAPNLCRKCRAVLNRGTVPFLLRPHCGFQFQYMDNPTETSSCCSFLYLPFSDRAIRFVGDLISEGSCSRCAAQNEASKNSPTVTPSGTQVAGRVLSHDGARIDNDSFEKSVCPRLTNTSSSSSVRFASSGDTPVPIFALLLCNDDGTGLHDVSAIVTQDALLLALTEAEQGIGPEVWIVEREIQRARNGSTLTVQVRGSTSTLLACAKITTSHIKNNLYNHVRSIYAGTLL
ncbi:MAG: hypothetical protein MHM6MM_004698 [Cercozoa sp. M6MM]